MNKHRTRHKTAVNVIDFPKSEPQENLSSTPVKIAATLIEAEATPEKPAEAVITGAIWADIRCWATTYAAHLLLTFIFTPGAFTLGWLTIVMAITFLAIDWLLIGLIRGWQISRFLAF